jgi:hypothetical protein
MDRMDTCGAAIALVGVVKMIRLALGFRPQV